MVLLGTSQQSLEFFYVGVLQCFEKRLNYERCHKKVKKLFNLLELRVYFVLSFVKCV